MQFYLNYTIHWQYKIFYQSMRAEGIASLRKSLRSFKAPFENPLHVCLQEEEDFT